jgi:lipoprotein-anchoring transpeptidase ErfK/SrfK
MSQGYRRRGLLVGMAGMAALVSLRVAAQGAKASASADLEMAATALKPGEWIWAPEIAPAGPMLIYVDLSRQTATVYRNGVRIGVSTISSGKAGHETPTGVFTILQKDANHHSNKYNDAPMPFQERLTWDGVALHAGGVPSYPESHGCVHLPYAFAKALFRETRIGMTVVMTNGESTEPATAATLVAAAPESPSPNVTTDASPEAPITLVASKRD